MPNTGWCQFWDPTAVFDAQSGHVLLLAAFASSVGTTAATSNNSVYLWRSTDLGKTFSERPENLDAILNESGDYPPSIGVAGQCRITARSTDGGVSFHSAVRRTPFYYVIF